MTVLGRVAREEPLVKSIISAAVDDAASYVEHLAIKLGQAAPPEHTARVIQIVETLRAATLGQDDKPKHRI